MVRGKGKEEVIEMPQPSSKEMTQLLSLIQQGDIKALNLLTSLVYDELHSLASFYMQRERRGHTLQTTALVHEAYLKLVDQQNLNHLHNRAHFFGIAARAMRQVLVDYSRKHKSAKRGHGGIKISLNEVCNIQEKDSGDILELDAALSKLEIVDARKARIVELRYFTGLTIQETALLLQTSPATVKRDWNLAKAWLFREIGKG